MHAPPGRNTDARIGTTFNSVSPAETPSGPLGEDVSGISDDYLLPKNRRSLSDLPTTSAKKPKLGPSQRLWSALCGFVNLFMLRKLPL